MQVFRTGLISFLTILLLTSMSVPAMALGGIWHDPYGDDDLYTVQESERYPRDPKAGEQVFIKMNTWPIEPGQAVWVEWSRNGTPQTPIGAAWKYNSSSDTYWEAALGSFNKGDRIEYTVYANQNGANTKSAGPYQFTVTDWESLTKINSYMNLSNRIQFQGEANTGIFTPQLNLLFENSETVRVQLSPNGSGNFASGQAVYTIHESASHYDIKTSSMTVRIQKNPFRMSIYDADGTTLLTEHSSPATSRTMSWLTNGTTIIDQVQDHFSTSANEQFYGFGERYSELGKRGQEIENYVFNQYLNQNEKTYMAIPYFVSTKNYGLLVNSTYYSKFEMASSGVPSDQYRFSVHTGGSPQSLLDYTIYTGSDMKGVMSNYAQNVALPQLPPKWGFGLWLSANEWDRQTEVMDLLTKLDTYQIPSTAIVLEQWSDEETFYIWNDATYTAKPGNQVFTAADFNFSGKWTDPKAMIDSLHDAGLKVLLWQNPSQKYTPYAYEQKDNDTAYMLSQNYNVKDGQGGDYRIPANGWFGNSLVPDFTNPAAEEWWLSKRKYLLEDMNIDGFKTDGGEIIWGRDTTFYNGKKGDEMRNQFPNEYIRAFYDFAKSYKPDAMSFSRAGTTGIQQYPALWAGDQDSSFNTMQQALKAGLSANLSGVPFWSWDVGGFTGDYPSAELYKRSVALGAFTPIMQIHSEKANPAISEERTPWNAAARNGNDTSIIDTFKKFTNLRMNLLPYIYSEAAATSATGVPFMRAMSLEYPQDNQTHSLQYQYMFGSNLLVAPIVEGGTNIKNVYLPEGEWIDFFYGAQRPGNQTIAYYADADSIPVFVKAGAIIPLNLNADYQLTGAIGNSLDQYTNLVFRIYPSGSSAYDWQDDIGGGPVGKSVKQIQVNESYATGEVTATLPPMDMHSTLQVFASKPSGVTINHAGVTEYSSKAALHAAAQGWYYDAADKFVYVKAAAGTSTRTVKLSGTAKAEYEAEYAAHHQVSTNTNHAGFLGSGFVDGFETVGDYVEFDVFAANSGAHQLDIAYTSAGGAASRNVYVNGVYSATAALPGTSSWSSWQTVTLPVNLSAGHNIIRLQYDSGNTLGINVDYIRLR